MEQGQDHGVDSGGVTSFEMELVTCLSPDYSKQGMGWILTKYEVMRTLRSFHQKGVPRMFQGGSGGLNGVIDRFTWYGYMHIFEEHFSPTISKLY